MKYQVFISYRRDGGEAFARLVRDHLTNMGYSVFYDVESLKSGRFDKKLLKIIEECDDVVVALPPQALDRCVYEEDWVRQEIHHAIKCKKTIVPLLMRGFVFPPDLPMEIRAISSMNGVNFETMEFFEARMEKLSSMLTSKPRPVSGNNGYNTGKPTLIRNVCSKASRDYEKFFPIDGVYSDVINRDHYPVIYFHLSTSRIDKDSIKSGMRIFDANNALVYEQESDVEWQSHNNRLSKRWIIKEQDGEFIKTGRYRAEFWIEDSAVFEYYFQITAENDPGTTIYYSPETERKIKKLEDNLSRPRGFAYHLWCNLCSLAGLSIIAIFEDLLMLLPFLLFSFIGYVKLVKYTKQHTWNSWLGSIALTTILSIYYGLYLFLCTIVCWFMRSKWKKELAKAKHPVN